MNPVYPRSDYAPISDYDAYTVVLANNGSPEFDFVRPRGRNWIVLEPEDLLAGLSGRFPNINRIYGMALPPGRNDRFTKFRTIMAILNMTARTGTKAMSKSEFVEIVMKSMPSGGTNPWDKYELMAI